MAFGYLYRCLEDLGVSAVVVEDKSGSKCTSLAADAVHELEDPRAFVEKIAHAKSQLPTRDFLVPIGLAPVISTSSPTMLKASAVCVALPHRVDEIPEAREWPSLKRLLISLNAPQSPLMTLGCGVFLYPPELPNKPIWTAFAYLGYCFADMALNQDAQIYFPQFFHFCRHHRALQDPDANVCFELRETLFFEKNVAGFSMDYIVRTWGESRATLAPLITRHLDALHDLLARMTLTSEFPPSH